MKQRDDTNKQTQPAGRRSRRTRKDNHVTLLNLYIDIHASTSLCHDSVAGSNVTFYIRHDTSVKTHAISYHHSTHKAATGVQPPGCIKIHAQHPGLSVALGPLLIVLLELPGSERVR